MNSVTTECKLKLALWLIKNLLSDAKHPFNLTFISLRNNGSVTETSLLIIAFFGENVPFKRTLALDFSSCSKRKSLLGTGVGFHFRHYYRYLIVNLFSLFG
jgi:hypothetical protein